MLSNDYMHAHTNQRQMNFALNALFCASSDLRLDTLSLKSSRHEPPITSSVRGLRVEEADDGELRAKDDEDACLRATIAALGQQAKTGRPKLRTNPRSSNM
jgi:hypothetical protein